MLDPLDRFLGLHPGEPRFLDQASYGRTVVELAFWSHRSDLADCGILSPKFQLGRSRFNSPCSYGT